MSANRSVLGLTVISALAGALLAAPAPAAAQVLLHVQGTFYPGLPFDENGQPYLDYTLSVATPGLVTIELTSANTSTYDPYLRLFLGRAQVAYDDDGAGALNSRITQFLQPGVYTVRVSKFGRGHVTAPTPFTLTATGAGGGLGTFGMGPGFAPLTEALAMTLAAQFYHTRSEWAGQYVMTPSHVRLVPSGPGQYQAHVRYGYACARGRCRGAPSGYDQRIFIITHGPSGWQITHMGGHMSATF